MWVSMGVGVMTYSFQRDPIDFIRFLAIALMFYSHYPLAAFAGMQPFSQVDGVIYQFFHDGLSRASSPFLGIVSGYFVYLQLQRYGYWTVVKKRFVSLFLPAVFWSMVFFAIVLLFFQVMSVQNHRFEALSGWRLVNLIVPVQYWPANVPTHYLVDLFKLCLVSPLIVAVVMRCSFWGKLGILCALFLVPNSLADMHNEKNLLPRWDLVVFFFAGIFAASEKINLTAAVSQKINGYLCAGLVGFVFVAAQYWSYLMASDVFGVKYLGYLTFMSVKVAGIFLVIAAVQVLMSFDAVVRRAPSRETIFLAFCTHSILAFFVVRFGHLVSDQLGGALWPQFALFFAFPLFAFALAAGMMRIKVARAQLRMS